MRFFFFTSFIFYVNTSECSSLSSSSSSSLNTSTSFFLPSLRCCLKAPGCSCRRSRCVWSPPACSLPCRAGDQCAGNRLELGGMVASVSTSAKATSSWPEGPTPQERWWSTIVAICWPEQLGRHLPCEGSEGSEPTQCDKCRRYFGRRISDPRNIRCT